MTQEKTTCQDRSWPVPPISLLKGWFWFLLALIFHWGCNKAQNSQSVSVVKKEITLLTFISVVAYKIKNKINDQNPFATRKDRICSRIFPGSLIYSSASQNVFSLVSFGYPQAFPGSFYLSFSFFSLDITKWHKESSITCSHKDESPRKAVYLTPFKQPKELEKMRRENSLSMHIAPETLQKPSST